MFKAFIKIETAFGNKIVRVFPRSKKVNTFATIADAVKRLESLRTPGRGFVVPAADRFSIEGSFTVAL